MLLQILAHTPTWVFALFGVLLWVGIQQRSPGVPAWHGSPLCRW